MKNSGSYMRAITVFQWTCFTTWREHLSIQELKHYRSRHIWREVKGRCYFDYFQTGRCCLFSLLSGLDESDVKKYFKKYLTGRVNGKATILVNTRKKFEFIYRKKSLQLCIVFHYGVWNKAGFPLHNWIWAEIVAHCGSVNYKLGISCAIYLGCILTPYAGKQTSGIWNSLYSKTIVQFP